MQTIGMDSRMKAGVEDVVIQMMTPILRDADIDLADMEQVRSTLFENSFGVELIDSCAERAAAEAMQARKPKLTRREAEAAGVIAPRQSGRDWQDDVYVKMMADELVARHVDLGDMAVVTATIRAANFSALSTERLAERAADAARAIRHAA